MGEDARIRRAAPGDRARLVSLWLDLVAHHRRLDPDYPAVPGIRDALQREIERGLTQPACGMWLAEAADEPVGFLFAEVEATGSPASGGGLAWIHELFVAPEARRRGIASRLVEAALAFFAERGSSRTAVRVESANSEGERFWRARGFGERARILERRGPSG